MAPCIGSSGIFNAVRNVFVDRAVRDQAELLADTTAAEAATKLDPCVHVFPQAGTPRLAAPAEHVATVGAALYGDVDVHAADGGARTLFDVVDHAATLGGRACLRALLNAPIFDRSTLLARQAALRDMAGVLARSGEEVAGALAAMRAAEPDVAWLLRHPHHDDDVRALYEMAFFKMWPLRKLNGSPPVLTAANAYSIVFSPLIGLLTPIASAIIPFLVLRRAGMRCSFVDYVRFLMASFRVMAANAPSSIVWAKTASIAFSLVFWFQGIFSSIEISRTVAAVCSSICRHVDRMDAFVRGARTLVRVCAPLRDSVRTAFFADLTQDPAVVAPPHDDRPPCGPGRWLLFRNFGSQLSAFKKLDHESLKALMRDAYALDAVAAVLGARTAIRGCDVEFVQSDAPVFDAAGLRHPCIPLDVAVANPLQLSRETSCAALFSGCNASGKSTVLKSVLLTTLLAQTLTIAPCDSLRISPFARIHSHINVPDVQGSMSLFQAEMVRALESLEGVARMSAETPDRLALVVMDEVFSSTNPIEGIAGAYAVAKHLASNRNAAVIVSTHYTYLRRLATLPSPHAPPAKGRHPLFKLLQMSVVPDPGSPIGFRFPYILRPGVCEQLIALDLLQAAGFCNDVVWDAMAVKRSLLLPPPRHNRTPNTPKPKDTPERVRVQGRRTARTRGRSLQRKTD